MIRINLALKKQAAYAAAEEGTSSGGGLAGFFKKFKSGASEGTANSELIPTLIKIGVPLVLCAVAYFGFDYYVESQNEEFQNEKAVIEKEKTKIEQELAKIKGFEKVKVELERNELIIKTKIDTIERLINGRDFTAKSLITLAQSLPKEVWLVELNANEKNYSFKGGTIDIGIISDVMTHLGQTIYFKDVVLKNTTADANGKQANFELTARRD